MPVDKLATAIRDVTGMTFDIALIDCADGYDGHVRMRAAGEASRLLTRDGCLVFDNSDRPCYQHLGDLLAGWRLQRFTGYTAKPLTPVETTVAHRTDRDGSSGRFPPVS